MVQVEVSVDSGEAFDRALARFKKMCGKAGIETTVKPADFIDPGKTLSGSRTKEINAVCRFRSLLPVIRRAI